MKKIQKYFIERPIAVSMLFLTVTLLGLISLFKIELNLLPDIELGKITILTSFRGSSPEETEKLITMPLISAVGSVRGVKKIESETSAGFSIIQQQFEWKTDMDYAAMEVREKIDTAKRNLPEGYKKPLVRRMNPSDQAFYEIALFENEKLSNSEGSDLRYRAEKEIKPVLERVEGVARIEIQGGREKIIHADIRPDVLNSYGLTLSQVRRSILDANRNISAGIFRQGDSEIPIRVDGEFRRLTDSAEVPITTTRGNSHIYFRDLAEMKFSYKPQSSFARYAGSECVIISLYKEAGKNTVKTSRKVSETVENLNARYSSQFVLTAVFDRSEYIKSSIGNIIFSLVLGAVLAFFCVLFFLRNFKTAVILILAVFSAVLSSFLFMYLFKMTMNLMSLGGLALGTGMLFDSGNVVFSSIENCKLKYNDNRRAALEGVLAVNQSVVSAVLTTSIVFVPVVFVKSFAGIVFSEMALAIIISLSMSLAFSLFFLPVLYSMPIFDGLLKIEWFRRIYNYSLFSEQKILVFYEMSLRKIIHRPVLLFFYIFPPVVISILVFPQIRIQFVPDMHSGEIVLEINNSDGASLDSIRRTVLEAENKILSFPETGHLISAGSLNNAGGSSSILDNTGGFIRIFIKEKFASDETKFVMKLKSHFRNNTSVQYRIFPGRNAFSSIFSPEKSDAVFYLKGGSISVLDELGMKMAEGISQIQSVSWSEQSLRKKNIQKKIIYNDDRLSGAEVSSDLLTDYISAHFQGIPAGYLSSEDDNYEIRMRLKDSNQSDMDRLLGGKILSDQNNEFYISDLISVTSQKQYNSVRRIGAERVNYISAGFSEGNYNKIYKKIETFCKNFKLPEGYSLREGGERDSIKTAIQDVTLTFVLSTFLIFMLLSAQFESFIHSFRMILVVPLLLAGVFPALFFTGGTLNVSSFTGIILLTGVVVDNSVLFYEYKHLCSAKNLDPVEASVKAGKLILKPVSMNFSTTLFALLPVALQIFPGTEFQAPMASAVIGGLFVSTVISLYLMPLLYRR